MECQTGAAYGVYPQNASLSEVMRTLNEAGFAKENICMMLSPTHPIAAVVRDASLFNAEREATAVTAGLIGWLSAFGAVVIPTLGFFVRSHLFFHALVTARDSRALCGSTSTLAGFGLPDEDAERFEDLVRRTGALIYVSCPEGAKTDWAREILRQTGAQEVATLEKTPGMSAVA